MLASKLRIWISLNSFMQNLLLDRYSQVEAFNKAARLHITPSARRAVFLVETKQHKDENALATIRNIFSARTRDFITALDDSGIIVVRELQSTESYEELEGIACMLVDMLNTEAMTSAWVSYSNVADDIMELSDAYKEARTALEVGKIFYAAEPFFLADFKKEDFLKANAETLKYFLIVSMLLFLMISLFSDFFGLILGSDFRDGLFIIPVVLFANIGNGIVFNLSFWYKRTGKTRLAILVTGSGLICTIVFNLLLLPRLGYAGTAWAHLGSEWIMVIVSYILSRIYYPVPYPLKRILFYLSGGILFYFLGAWQKDISWTGNILFNLSLIVIYTGVVVKVEKINISRHPF